MFDLIETSVHLPRNPQQLLLGSIPGKVSGLFKLSFRIRMTHRRIPIVDLFAGPGGLGEGFSAVRDLNGERIFEICTSIEKDPAAHRTLTLRALFRALGDGPVPEIYYDYIRGHIDSQAFSSNPIIASALEYVREEAHCLELGSISEKRVDALIRKGINGHNDWVLIGGPPCQAYSMAGRSRRRRVDPNFEDDPKHFLYQEYLRIIQQFQPSIFVMENVTGMLSSTHNGQSIFGRIMKDLSQPAPGVLYDIRSFVTSARGDRLEPNDFTIRSEDFGIPQMRHRVILFGVRSDRAGQAHDLLMPCPGRVSVRDALAGLPPLRSRLSKEPDSRESWLQALREAKMGLKGWRSETRTTMEALMAEATLQAQRLSTTGAAFIPKDVQPSRQLAGDLASWIHDSRLGGVCQHEARSHMRSDLHRYLFASCFAKENYLSPKLNAFPNGLLPNHRNVNDESVPFGDRFRVQVYRSPATTVVSHIAKDGHYYIHPDPSQCRSLTVREAARLQTFPDNYFFEGNRTQQYHQVGNAVPPFLAWQLAKLVAQFMKRPSTKAAHAPEGEGHFAEA